MLHKSFKPAKCKTALKLAIPRMKLLNNKREAHIKQLKRELAQLLESGQVQTARIRVEHVVREEKTLTAYNLIQIYCELIAARLPIIESQKNCPIDLKEAIASVIFAAPRCADVPELSEIRKHFTAKYGKEFVSAAVELRPDCGVNRMLVEKLSAKAPDGHAKIKILSKIAEEHNVDWDPDTFGGHESNPSQDLLNGPSTFETASRIHTEAPPGPATPARDDSGPPNVQVPPKQDVKHDVFVNYKENRATPSSGSQNFASTDVAANRAATSGAFFPEVRSSGSGAEQMEYKHSYPGNENNISSDRQKWKMQFKDATSAAQAAAESAELASMAARAAAELSRQYSSESQDSYGYVSKEEGGQTYADSKVHSERVFKDAENSFHRRSSGIHNENTVDKDQEEQTGAPESFPRRAHKTTEKYSTSASLKSSSASIDDDALVKGLQTANRHSQDKSSDYYRSDLLHEVSKKEQSSDFESKSINEMQDRVKYGENAYSNEKVTRKQTSSLSYRSHSSSSGDDQEDVLRKDEHIAYDRDRKTEKQSSRVSSRSHSSSFGDIHKDNFTINDPGENPFVHDGGSIYRNTSEVNSNENTAKFDDYDSDDDNYKVDVLDYKRQETSLFFSSPSRKSSSDLLAGSTVWSPRKNTDEGLRKSISQSHPSVFTESSIGSTVPSQPEDLPPAAFDDYNSPRSDSEDDLPMSKLDKFPSVKNVHSRGSELMKSESHNSAGSSSSENEDVGSRRTSRFPTPSFDPEPKEMRSVGSQGRRSSPVSEKKFGYDESPTGQPASRLKKSGLDLNVKESQELHDTMEDTEHLTDSTFESSKELNFGTLTGGLRNKKNRAPLYVRKPSGESLSFKQAINETHPEIKQSSSSPTVGTSIGSRPSNQEPYNERGSAKANKKIGVGSFAQDLDSNNHLEEELPQEASTNQKLYNERSGIEVNRRSNLRDSYFDSNISDSDEDFPKSTPRRTARPSPTFSRRTKASSSNSGKAYSKNPGFSTASATPNSGTEIKSSSGSFLATGITRPSPQTKRSDHSGSQERHRLVEQDTPKPIPESRRPSRIESLESPKGAQTSISLKSIPEPRRSSHNESLNSPERERTSISLKPIPEPRRSSRTESLKSSKREQTSNSPPKIVTSESRETPKSQTVGSGETSSQEKASHVHPKLPDSDAFAAFFQSIRQNR
ncbi:hypothetical protein UlMin_022658 [Ulmus minor]